MGSGRDKRKKNNPKPPGHGAAKTESKTKKNEDKALKRAEKRLKGDEDDIDAILERIKAEEAAKVKVVVQENATPPTPRVNCSFVPYVTQRSSEIIMFGGECFDNNKTFVFGDLFRYQPDKNSWTLVSSPNSPPPRSAHQAVVYKNFMFVFGGEYTSPNQERFHHYRDLWRLDLATNTWDNLPVKGGPSARSGHRMVCYKSKLILFGGFYDTGNEFKYYNDLWVYDIEALKWEAVGNPALGPSPRSACQLTLFEDRMFLYGGYFKEQDDEDDMVEHGKVHSDLWSLDLKSFKWEKVKKQGMAPGPRAGFAMAVHKRRALLFGGVADQETRKGEDMVSEFFNELYTYAFDTQRWFPVALKPPKKGKDGSASNVALDSVERQLAKAAIGEEEGPRGQGGAAARQANLTVEQRAAIKIQAHFRGYVVRKAYKAYKIGGVVSELLYSPALYGVDLSAKDQPKPKGRINASICVLGNDLWVFGGLVEVGSGDKGKEVTLDDIWKLDLAKLEGWTCVRLFSAPEEVFKEDGMGGDSSDGDDSGMGSDDDDSQDDEDSTEMK